MPPESPEALNNIGELHFRMQRLDEQSQRTVRPCTRRILLKPASIWASFCCAAISRKAGSGMKNAGRCPSFATTVRALLNPSGGSRWMGKTLLIYVEQGWGTPVCPLFARAARPLSGGTHLLLVSAPPVQAVLRICCVLWCGNSAGDRSRRAAAHRFPYCLADHPRTPGNDAGNHTGGRALPVPPANLVSAWGRGSPVCTERRSA